MAGRGGAAGDVVDEVFPEHICSVAGSVDGQAAAAGLADRVSTPSGPALELGERVEGARFDRADAVGAVCGPGRAMACGR